MSFFLFIYEHTLDVRFYDLGAGETMSSGTGSTGAVAAAMDRGLVSSPVKVNTPAGPLYLRGESTLYLAGTAEIVSEGTYYMRE